jgi:hypothetical protein
MPTPDEYAKLAEQCYRMANEARTETDRQACLDLARNWLEAASCQHELTPEQIARAQKSELVWQLKPKVPKRKTLSRWRQRVLGLFR